MNYDKETKNAYRNELKAKEYYEQYVKGAKWARFTMWRQRGLIDKIVTNWRFEKGQRILDVPCGTGLIGKILCKSPASITASDISREMMKRAYKEYEGRNFNGFVQCDITQMPFRAESFDCVILLAIMHRLPKEIRYKTWEEIVDLTTKFIIVSYSVDSRAQRVKQWLIKKARPNYVAAPSSIALEDIVSEINSYGFIVRQVYKVAYFLSAKKIFLLEKENMV